MAAGVRERLAEDRKSAMRAKETLRLSTIRMARSEILNKDKEGREDISEEEILKLLQSMVKRREEASEQFAKGGRPELAEKEREEIGFLRNYLPAQMDKEEIAEEARAAIAELEASSMREMGKVMGFLTKKLAGRAPGALISQVVKELLGG